MISEKVFTYSKNRPQAVVSHFKGIAPKGWKVSAFGIGILVSRIRIQTVKPLPEPTGTVFEKREKITLKPCLPEVVMRQARSS